MAFEIGGDESLTAALRVRLTAVEKQRLQQDADLAGLTMSELVRRRYFGRPLVASADMALIRELRYQGELLKQLIAVPQREVKTEASAALQTLIACLERIANDH